MYKVPNCIRYGKGTSPDNCIVIVLTNTYTHIFVNVCCKMCMKYNFLFDKYCLVKKKVLENVLYT